MYYCFIKEDIENLENDPLCIQMKYAEKMGRLCICDLKENSVYDLNHKKLSVNGKHVFLRGSYDNVFKGIKMLELNGAKLVETEADINKIESWSELGMTKRTFYSTNVLAIISTDRDESLNHFLESRKRIFLKSKKKGFCANVSVDKIINRDEEFRKFIGYKGLKYGNELIMTDLLELKTDSLGSKESRHVIYDGSIINSSRRIHSLKHNVPKSHLQKAKEIVEHIKKNENYPSNYVLDIGEFTDGTMSYLDIVEINPISSSLCYVNNSIYTECIEEIHEVKERLHMGNEYCYDALQNPTRYNLLRNVNKNYLYGGEEYYKLG